MDSAANDILLRNLALPVLIVGFLVAFSYRIRSNTKEPLDRRQEGLAILITLRLLALVAFGTVGAWLINPENVRFASVELPLGLRMAGIPLAALAFAWVIWTFHTLGHNLTDTVVTRSNATLVIKGPYRFVRHPFYFGFSGVLMAVSLISANWLIAVSAASAFVLIVLRTPIEEQKLIDRFGAAYVQYMEKTGRFFPRLGK